MTHLPHICLSVIPHKEQRYPTIGDYFPDRSIPGWQFNVSRLSSPDHEFLVAIHELIEWYLTQKRGIKERDITRFDKEYEKNRKIGDVSEPGDSSKAPYHREHVFATKIERLIAKELGVDWKEYEDDINSL